MSRTNLVASTQTVRLPKDVVEEMYRASVRFAELLETLEVLLDKKTMRRIKLGERQYKRTQYVVAKGPRQIRRVLST
jgi:hypothetical protein